MSRKELASRMMTVLVGSKVGSLLSMKMYYSGTVVCKDLGHEKIRGEMSGVDSTPVSRKKVRFGGGIRLSALLSMYYRGMI